MVSELTRLKAHQYAYADRSEPPDIDLSDIESHVEAAPGKVIVVVWPERQRIGSLYVPDQTKNDLKPDIGTVIAYSGPELSPGDTVLLKSQAGKCVQGFHTGTWHTFYRDCCGELRSYEVRMYGRCGGATFNGIGDPVLAPMTVPWHHAVMATIENDMFKPLKSNFLFRFDPMETKTKGGIMLTDEHQTRSSLVTVVETGPDCKRVRPGDRTWVHEGDVRIAGSDLGLAPEEAVDCYVR